MNRFGNYSVYTHTKPHSLNHKMYKNYFPGEKGLRKWQNSRVQNEEVTKCVQINCVCASAAANQELHCWADTRITLINVTCNSHVWRLPYRRQRLVLMVAGFDEAQEKNWVLRLILIFNEPSWKSQSETGLLCLSTQFGFWTVSQSDANSEDANLSVN